MLRVQAGWDWFHNELTAEEKRAIAEGRLAAVMHEDGDDHGAVVSAVLDIKAPKEAVKFATLDPCIGDCFLAIAWDSRSVEVTMNEGEPEGEFDDEGEYQPDV